MAASLFFSLWGRTSSVKGAIVVRDARTIYEVIDPLYVFPTLLEAIKIAAQSFLRDVEKMPCCAE
jgi:hypothetical protein